MSKTKITLISTAALAVTGSALLMYLQNNVADRFHYLDASRVRKAYRRMLWLALTGKLPHITGKSDIEIDEVFLGIFYTVK